MANFEAFHWNISSSINLLFLNNMYLSRVAALPRKYQFMNNYLYDNEYIEMIHKSLFVATKHVNFDFFLNDVSVYTLFKLQK